VSERGRRYGGLQKYRYKVTRAQIGSFAGIKQKGFSRIKFLVASTRFKDYKEESLTMGRKRLNTVRKNEKKKK